VILLTAIILVLTRKLTDFDITDPLFLHLRQWLLPLCYQKTSEASAPFSNIISVFATLKAAFKI
jgi:hypothetical protein